MQMHIITTDNPAAARTLATLLDDAGFVSVDFMTDTGPTIATMAPTVMVAKACDIVAALFGYARGLL